MDRENLSTFNRWKNAVSQQTTNAAFLDEINSGMNILLEGKKKHDKTKVGDVSKKIYHPDWEEAEEFFKLQCNRALLKQLPWKRDLLAFTRQFFGRVYGDLK